MQNQDQIYPRKPTGLAHFIAANVREQTHTVLDWRYILARSQILVFH